MSQVDDLKAAGFSDDEVSSYAQEKRQTLSGAGFSDQEINDYLGAPAKPQPDAAGANKSFARVLGDAFTSAAAKLKPAADAAAPALQTIGDIGSVYAPIEAALNAGTGMLFGFPSSIAAGLTGLVAKHALGMDVDPKQMADTMSQVMTYQPHTERGIRLSGNLMYPLAKLAEGADVAGHKMADYMEGENLGGTSKMPAIIGAVTDATVNMLPMILGGELAKKMGGQTVTSEDMANTAKVIAGHDAPPAAVESVENSLRATYDKTGIGPFTVAEHALKDPELKAELADPKTEVPSVYQEYLERKAEEPEEPGQPVATPGDGAPLLDINGQTAEEIKYDEPAPLPDNWMERVNARNAAYAQEFSSMSSEELEAAHESAIGHNKAAEIDAARMFLGPEKADELASIKSTRSRDRWLDQNVTPEMQDHLNEVQLPEDMIRAYRDAANDFDTESPEMLGRSIALIARDVDRPGFMTSPEGLTFRNALKFAASKGWDMDEVLPGMRARAEEWAGDDAPELMPRLFKAAMAKSKQEEHGAIGAKQEEPKQLTNQSVGSEHAVGNLGISEVPLKDITLSNDVPQFKSDAGANGVVEPLGGKFDRTGVAPIQLWKRTNGDLEVISGRHRFDLAQRSGENTIPAQIHYEDQGFDARKASALDAELNIRDGQGKVRDYVDYFRATQIDQATAEQRGLLARSIGKRAFAIASNGGDELVAAHRAGQLTDDAATAIANAAPGDQRLQAVGIKAIQDGKTIGQAANMVRAVKLLAGDREDTTGDMFGFDDSAMREAENMAKIATAKQRELTTRLGAISGAAKRPEIAAAEGINVKDSAAVLKRIEELKAERAQWDNWSTNPELVEKIRQELHPGEDVGEPLLTAQTPEDLQAKAAREANAPALDLKDQIDREADHFTLQGETQEPFDTTGDLFGSSREGMVALNAGVNPVQAVRNIRDSYTPFVGVEVPTRPAGLDRPGAPKSPLMDSIKKIFAPASRGVIAERMAGIMRANLGEMAHQREVALERLKSTAAMFDKLPVKDNIRFIDAIERGTELPPGKMADAAKALRTLLDAKRDEVQELGKGQLQNFNENYFPHIWKDADPGTMQEMFSRRPLEGSKAFLKQRTIPFTTDGLRWRAYDESGDFIRSFDSEAAAKIAAGTEGRVGKPLTPVTTNPVELALLKAREMDKYIYGQKIFGEMKGAGLARFVKFGERALPGWTKINDKIATVYRSAETTIHEAYDRNMMDGLNKFAQDIGVKATRSRNIAGGPGVWGWASRDGRVATKFGGPESVLTHEIGHQLDFKYGLADQFVKDPATKKELRALADLRYEGETEVPDSYKAYVRKGTEKMANMVHAFVHMPDRMQQVAPNTYAKFSQFLDEHPELSGLRDIQPSLRLGTDSQTVNPGAMMISGEYYAPDEAATLINNHLSPGLQGNAFYDAFRGIGMAMNSLQLGLSLFHVGFTTMDSMISKVALGMKQFSRGDFGQGLGNVVQGVNPVQPIANIIRGDKLLRAYLDPSSNPDLLPIVDMLTQAGGRVKMDDFYRNTTVNTFKQALRNGDTLGAAKSFLPTVLDRVSAPIFEELVPRQKLGVFFDMAKDWLEKNPDATVAEKRSGAAALWDSVDNRMGQLVYDNVFWNRALKDGLMATVRSVGWNLGTFRELGGGVLDIANIAKDKGFSDRTAYVAALPMVAAVYGAALGYAYTGQAPESLKDCFYPRTGKLRPDGTEDRVSLPTYMKDVFAYGEDATNFAKYGGDPTQTIKNKMHPAISTVSQMLNNADFFGGAIRNPADKATQQIMDEAAYLIQQIEPFSMRNYLQQAKAKGEEPSILGYLTSPSMIGITPAPGYITKSPAEQESAQVNRMHEPLLEKFKEQIRGGADAQELIPEMMKSGMSKQDIRYIISSSQATPRPHRLKAFGADEDAE